MTERREDETDCTRGDQRPYTAPELRRLGPLAELTAIIPGVEGSDVQEAGSN